MDGIDRTMKPASREIFDKTLQKRREAAEQRSHPADAGTPDMVEISGRGGGAERAGKAAAAEAPAPKAGAKGKAPAKAEGKGETKALEPPKEKEWTVLCYIDGHNDLEQAAVFSLLDLESVGSNENVNVVAELGRLSQDKLKEISEGLGRPYEPTGVDGDWSGVRRYYVRQDDPTKPEQVAEINSTLVKDLKEKDMSDPATLGDFLVWGMKKYPAKHYLVVLMDHGGGWKGAFTDDASASGDRIMKPQGITDALKLAETATGKKPDVVDMVACLMATGEVAYEMRDASKFLVASEEMGTTAAFQYSPIIAALQAVSEKPDQITPKQLAQFLVEYYRDKPEAFVTKSAIDLEKMDGVKTALADFSKALMKTKTSHEVIRKTINQAQQFSKVEEYGFYLQFRDLYDIANQMAKSREVKDPALKEAARAMMSAVKEAVVANVASAYQRTDVLDQTKSKDGKEDVTLVKVSTGKFDSHGISIYAPTEEKYVSDKVMREYKELALSQETPWDDFLVHENKPEKPKKKEA